MRWLRRLWHRRFGHGEVLIHEKNCYFCNEYRLEPYGRYPHVLQDFDALPAYCPVCDKHYLWVVPGLRNLLEDWRQGREDL